MINSKATANLPICIKVSVINKAPAEKYIKDYKFFWKIYVDFFLCFRANMIFPEKKKQIEMAKIICF